MTVDKAADDYEKQDRQIYSNKHGRESGRTLSTEGNDDGEYDDNNYGDDIRITEGEKYIRSY